MKYKINKENVIQNYLDKKEIRKNCPHNNLFSLEEINRCEFIKKNGISESGKQKYYCKLWGATECENVNSNRMSWKEIKRIFYLEQIEGLSLRKIAKRLGYSVSTISKNRKWAMSLSE